MHITTHFFEEYPETKIRAAIRAIPKTATDGGDSVILVFKQDRPGGDQINIHLPSRMASCVETIARVFNECMDAKPQSVAIGDFTQNGDGGQPPEVEMVENRAETSRGQYIGLTRDLDERVPIGGLNRFGHVRMDDDGPARVFAAGGVLIVTAEVAMQATKHGWELAPEHPTSGDLVAIKR